MLPLGSGGSFKCEDGRSVAEQRDCSGRLADGDGHGQGMGRDRGGRLMTCA